MRSSGQGLVILRLLREIFAASGHLSSRLDYALEDSDDAEVLAMWGDAMDSLLAANPGSEADEFGKAFHQAFLPRILKAAETIPHSNPFEKKP
jgi:hypothetical protein